MIVAATAGKSTRCLLAIALNIAATCAFGAQIDISPPGSVSFGSDVKVLPNGNIVVTDPDGPTASIGIVYLYTSAGIRIASFTGSSPNDRVGSGGIVVLPNGNFVVVSPQWNDAAVAKAGAVTWVNGSSGLNGVVSSANSLVGTSANDQVGYAINPVTPPYDSIADHSITVLANSNFVVSSLFWNNGAATQAGAVTFVDGATGIAGAVSAANSLVGAHSNDQIGSYSISPLGNGNAVVISPAWNSAIASQVGAVTWISGTQGLSGVVSASNSLVGLSTNDQIGSSGIAALTNNNYVVLSPLWNNGVAASAGAATWAAGNTSTSGIVSPANSLVGSTQADQIGFFATALTNGNYVVNSPFWNDGAVAAAGAATWGNGSVGTSGVVSASNSLVGSSNNDSVGVNGVFALSNGNYVVTSPQWSNGSLSAVGAATWGNGATGTNGQVSPANSLVGNSANDQLGNYGAAVLSNGNYVIPCVFCSNGAIGSAGAVTWADGSVGISGPVSSANSLVGTTELDLVGAGGVYALSNGNYVIDSFDWINAGAARAGAITWANGSGGVTGPVSSANSLVGTQANDRVGNGFITTLINGSFVVSSPNWNNAATPNAGALTWASGTAPISGAVSTANSLVGSSSGDAVGSFAAALSNGAFVTWSTAWNNAVTGASAAGAVTWGSGKAPIVGVVSSANSLVGTSSNDRLASGIVMGNASVAGIAAFSDGNYLVSSQHWNNGAIVSAGAITLANGRFPLVSNVAAYNSVRGTLANEGPTMPWDYEPIHKQLVVGRPLENTVSVFTMDEIFAEGFD